MIVRLTAEYLTYPVGTTPDLPDGQARILLADGRAVDPNNSVIAADPRNPPNKSVKQAAVRTKATV